MTYTDAGPWADWDRPFDTDNPLCIDATAYLGMADAIKEARIWFDETGEADEGVTPGRPTKMTMRLCDEHEGCSIDDSCRTERSVWVFVGHQSKP